MRWLSQKILPSKFLHLLAKATSHAVLACYSEKLARIDKDTGVRGLIRIIRDTMAGPWLDYPWLKERPPPLPASAWARQASAKVNLAAPLAREGAYVQAGANPMVPLWILYEGLSLRTKKNTTPQTWGPAASPGHRPRPCFFHASAQLLPYGH